MITGRYDIERVAKLEARIEQLEHILCPAQQHDWRVVHEQPMMTAADGDAIMPTKFDYFTRVEYACATCGKTLFVNKSR